MGWQDSRATLIHASCGPEWEELPNTRTRDGVPVNVVRFNRISEIHAPPACKSVASWLADRGFQSVCADDEMMFMKDDIQFELFGDEKQLLSETIVTFKLSRNSPSYWQSWTNLVVEICDMFELSVFDLESRMKTEPQQLIPVLSKTKSWQELHTSYGWPKIGT